MDFCKFRRGHAWYLDFQKSWNRKFMKKIDPKASHKICTFWTLRFLTLFRAQRIAPAFASFAVIPSLSLQPPRKLGYTIINHNALICWNSTPNFLNFIFYYLMQQSIFHIFDEKKKKKPAKHLPIKKKKIQSTETCGVPTSLNPAIIIPHRGILGGSSHSIT